MIPPDFYHYALTLFESILRFEPDAKMAILFCGVSQAELPENRASSNLLLIPDQDVCSKEPGKSIAEKYRLKNTDCYRWSLKPVIIKHLLEKNYEQVFYLDPDLFFVSCSWLGRRIGCGSILWRIEY